MSQEVGEFELFGFRTSIENRPVPIVRLIKEASRDFVSEWIL